MPKLNIPSRYKTSIAKIQVLTPAAFSELTSALENFQPASVNKDVISRIAGAAPHAASEDVERILETLVGLHMAMAVTDVPLEQFCSDIADEIQVDGHGAFASGSQERQKFVARLQTLLGFESLAIGAKAKDLQVDHGHVYANGRVITDIRPVFRREPDESPAGMVLFHTLKLTYWDRAGEGDRANFYIALDENDVSNLKRLLERAEMKAKTLRSQLQSSGMPILGDMRNS